MSSCYITVTGLTHYFGSEFIEPGMTLRLIKEPENEYDREAIRAEMDGLGKIGYVANSSYRQHRTERRRVRRCLFRHLLLANSSTYLQ